MSEGHVMNNVDNIGNMESILDNTKDLIKDTDKVLTKLEANLSSYEKLSEYYYSDQRMKDLDDDEHGLLPADLKRGVLDEDSIWNMQEDYREVALRLIETGTRMLRCK